MPLIQGVSPSELLNLSWILQMKISPLGFLKFYFEVVYLKANSFFYVCYLPVLTWQSKTWFPFLINASFASPNSNDYKVLNRTLGEGLWVVGGCGKQTPGSCMFLGPTSQRLIKVLCLLPGTSFFPSYLELICLFTLHYHK